MPNFNRAYLEKIGARVQGNISNFSERRNAIAKGRIIPDEDDLDIGTGRALSLAVLFLDICKFSNWPQSDSAEQNDILSIFNIYMAEMMRIAEDFGGEVEKNTGDGLMGYFGGAGDLAATDACQAAVGAALTMFYVTEKMINPLLNRDGFRQVDFRIGIDYGPVTVAVVGGKRRFKSMVAIGTTAVIANRILRECGRNELVVGELVRDNLPAAWKQYSLLLKQQTGFIYSRTLLSYPYYKYTGRWPNPT